MIKKNLQNVETKKFVNTNKCNIKKEMASILYSFNSVQDQKDVKIKKKKTDKKGPQISGTAAAKFPNIEQNESLYFHYKFNIHSKTGNNSKHKKVGIRAYFWIF